MNHIVLFEPDIPQNTGNIARTCAITGSKLHLIRPLGFRLDERSLKRSGLDYWDKVDVEVHDDFMDFKAKYSQLPLYLLTTKGKKYYHQVAFPRELGLIFGSEASGAPDWLHQLIGENRIKIPMLPVESLRSLNLSNSVSIVLYEVLRQQNDLWFQESNESMGI